MNVNYSEKNKTPGQIGVNTIRAAAGLALYGIGVYLTIQANIGVAPWDCLFLGICNHTVLSYGVITICIKLVIILIDFFIGERIGIGTIVDALVVGVTVDLCNLLNLLPPLSSTVPGILLMFLGLVVNGIGQYIYMQSALCCGPVDALMVGLSKKLPRVPIGAIGVVILTGVVIIGYSLGGPIGIGTVIGALCMTPIMQLVFQRMHFVPEDVIHQDFLGSFRVLMGRDR